MKPVAAEHSGFALGPAFVASFRLLRARPIVLPALGAAIVLSMSSVCCVIGLVTTPWFICELFATQLALCTGKPAGHSFSWVPAGSILLGAVLLVMGVASLTLLGAGPDLPPDAVRLTGLSTLMRSSGFFAAISAMLALLLVVPVLYAPLVLIERRTGFEEALLESVRLVVRRGVAASLFLSLAAHLVQVAPLLAAAGWAVWGTRAGVPQALLIAAPLLCVTVPLGQGMIIWTYARLRPEEPPLPEAIARAPHTAAALRTISRWIRIWTLAVALPVAALLGIGISLIRPSALPPGAAPPGELVTELVPAPGVVRRARLGTTSLEVSATPEHVSVVAADGGGTGELRLRERRTITSVRVVRVRDAFAIEARQGDASSLAWIDRAGVRLDDDLRARLMDRLSPRELVFVLGFPFLATLWTVPVLHRLARVQQAFRKFSDKRPSDEVLDLALRRSLRRTGAFVGVILPLDAIAIAIAVRALFGGG